MRTDFPPSVPSGRIKDIQKVTELIKVNAPVEMIILFGSFARGDFVSDVYKEGHITYEYQSDYDFLVIVRNKEIELNYTLWDKINDLIRADTSITTTVSILVDTIRFVNLRLNEGNYFYSDIRDEGVVLYDSKAFSLVESKKLSLEEQKKVAREDYTFWTKKAESYLKDYTHNMTDGEYSNAAFHLHQTAEALFVACLLVSTGYKPKTHNISKILHLLMEKDPRFSTVFPKTLEDEKRLYDLIERAYIDARYKSDYSASPADLEQLYKYVQYLKELTEDFCRPFIG